MTSSRATNLGKLCKWLFSLPLLIITLTTESSANPITVYHNDMRQQVKRMQVNCRGSFEAGGLAQRVTVN